MVEKIKKIFACIGAGIIAMCAVLFCRHKFNGAGGGGIEDVIDECKDDVERASGQNSELAKRVDRSTELASGIADDNRDAIGKLDEAIEILQRARERGTEGKD